MSKISVYIYADATMFRAHPQHRQITQLVTKIQNINVFILKANHIIIQSILTNSYKCLPNNKIQSINVCKPENTNEFVQATTTQYLKSTIYS